MSEMIYANGDTANMGGFLVNTYGSNAEDAKIVYNATSNAESLDSHKGERITIVGVIMERGIRADRNGGEGAPCVNTYIVDTAGRAYYSQSDGVARGMAKIGQLTDNFNTAEPITIIVEDRQLANGNTLKVVNWV